MQLSKENLKLLDNHVIWT